MMPNESLSQYFLTPDVRSQLEHQSTSFGVTLDDIIRSGVENPDSHVGCYAGDEESYSLFSPLLYPIIKKYHDYDPNNNFHQSDFDVPGLSGFDTDAIKSCRIRVARNLKGYPFSTKATKDQRLNIEAKILDVLQKLPPPYRGTYYSFNDKLPLSLPSNFIFRNEDRFLKSSGCYDYWPEGRGVFLSENKEFMIWINEEDHLRIIALNQGCDMDKLWFGFVLLLEKIGSDLDFSCTKNLGYLTSCPTNLGTSMRASVHIQLPETVESTLLKKHCSLWSLAVRGTSGEHTSVVGNTYDISNKKRLGLSEAMIIQSLVDGINNVARILM